MRRWILALTLFCLALTGLTSPPPGLGKWTCFLFAGTAQAAGERTAQMSKRRDQKQPDEDDSEDENPPPADDENSDDENDENEDSDDNADDNE